MTTLQALFLGAVAGGTIFFGLPVARLKNVPRTLQGFLNAIAVGILFFLLFDVLSKATEPVNVALNRARYHHDAVGPFALNAILLIGGLAVGLLVLVAFEKRFLRRDPDNVPTGKTLGYMIATGIGMHNFSEGLAIGQSAITGATQLAVLLIIGFGLHNLTEGFGISAPVGGNASWGFIALAGLIGGGPTFIGTAIGTVFQSQAIFILFLSLAAGSIIYVLSQLMPLMRRQQAQQLVMVGLVLGFTVAYGTDLVLVAAGA
ncbi:MAG: ZIP family metal transporter [Chloroflexota bacterium]